MRGYINSSETSKKDYTYSLQRRHTNMLCRLIELSVVYRSTILVDVVVGVRDSRKQREMEGDREMASRAAKSFRRANKKWSWRFSFFFLYFLNFHHLFYCVTI